MIKSLPLSCIPVGARGIISAVNGDFKNKDRLSELGFTKDTEVMALHKSPTGDPAAYYIKGSVMALRREDADNILIKFREKY